MKIQKGFTIIELIVVIAIIAVLATIVYANISDYIQKSKDARAYQELNNIAKAAQLDFAQCGHWSLDVYPGELPRFVYPNEFNNPEDEWHCVNAQSFLSMTDFNASFYCDGCKYDWQNWGENPDCILIDLYDENDYSIKEKCISVEGCECIDY